MDCNVRVCQTATERRHMQKAWDGLTTRDKLFSQASSETD